MAMITHIEARCECPLNVPAQPVDATQALNLSAGVSNPKVSPDLLYFARDPLAWDKSKTVAWPPTARTQQANAQATVDGRTL